MTSTEIRTACLAQGLLLATQQAYVLATVEHETAGTFQPVKEAYWLKDPDKWLKEHHPEYYPYYGRGFNQLTWKENYAKYSKITGKDLVKYPDLVLDPELALFILIHGFKTGILTGKKITDYINKNKTDFVGARRCINGTDKALHIANLARKYL